MSRDNEQYPCPKCGSLNTTKETSWDDFAKKLHTYIKCHHCQTVFQLKGKAINYVSNIA